MMNNEKVVAHNMRQKIASMKEYFQEVIQTLEQPDSIHWPNLIAKLHKIDRNLDWLESSANKLYKRETEKENMLRSILREFEQKFGDDSSE